MKNEGDDVLGALCIFLCVACYFDYRRGKIPNGLLLVMLMTGAVGKLAEQGGQGFFLFLLTAVLGMLFLYPLFKIGTLGAGDVKLFGICAGYFPHSKILYFLFYSMLIAAIVSLFKLFLQHNTRERMMYLGEYILGVLQSGHFSLYLENERDSRRAGICLSGPFLGGVLLYLGGIF